ncbi:hypothetical protein NKI86_26790 [Mesorhizobium sp. M0320]|uniref:hypothetical protein n=1 Tax=Mesorhizobium sp. M0320 TaxID=2956936 RepID=UPI00333AAC57
MIVMLEKGCGGRGKAVAAMMVSTALHRCERLDRGLLLASRACKELRKRKCIKHFEATTPHAYGAAMHGRHKPRCHLAALMHGDELSAACIGDLAALCILTSLVGCRR